MTLQFDLKLVSNFELIEELERRAKISVILQVVEEEGGQRIRYSGEGKPWEILGLLEYYRTKMKSSVEEPIVIIDPEDDSNDFLRDRDN